MHTTLTTICIVLAVVCALLLYTTSKSYKISLAEYRSKKQWWERDLCTADAMREAKNNLRSNVLGIIFFTGMAVFFIVVSILSAA